MVMKVNVFLLGFSISFGVAFLSLFVLICIHAKRHKNEFRCDGCGQWFSLDNNAYYVVKNEMLCKSCYSAMKAPYKVEKK